MKGAIVVIGSILLMAGLSVETSFQTTLWMFYALGTIAVWVFFGAVIVYALRKG